MQSGQPPGCTSSQSTMISPLVQFEHGTESMQPPQHSDGCLEQFWRCSTTPSPKQTGQSMMALWPFTNLLALGRERIDSKNLSIRYPAFILLIAEGVRFSLV